MASFHPAESSFMEKMNAQINDYQTHEWVVQEHGIPIALWHESAVHRAWRGGLGLIRQAGSRGRNR